MSFWSNLASWGAASRFFHVTLPLVRSAILAGGTDLYPARVGRPFDDDVLDAANRKELDNAVEAQRRLKSALALAKIPRPARRR